MKKILFYNSSIITFKIMDDKELKEYIDTTKKDLINIVNELKQEVSRMEDNAIVSSVALEKKYKS